MVAFTDIVTDITKQFQPDKNIYSRKHFMNYDGNKNGGTFTPPLTDA